MELHSVTDWSVWSVDKLDSPVAQWWSKKLLTSRLPVRVWPGEPFFCSKNLKKSRLGPPAYASGASLAGGAIFLLAQNNLCYYLN